MRTKMAILSALVIVLASCSTVRDNVSIDVDVKGIVASTCQQLASGFADQLADAVTELDAGAEVDLPNIDVGDLIGRASDLGCSPDDLEALVTERLGEIRTTSDDAKTFLDQVTSQLDGLPSE